MGEHLYDHLRWSIAAACAGQGLLVTTNPVTEVGTGSTIDGVELPALYLFTSGWTSSGPSFLPARRGRPLIGWPRTIGDRIEDGSEERIEGRRGILKLQLLGQSFIVAHPEPG